MGCKQRAQLLADLSNYVYMVGGGNNNDNPLTLGDIWMSYTKGATWVQLVQNAVSNIWVNSVFFNGAHDYCAALQVVANSAAPGGYHRSLSLYGGGNSPTAENGVTYISSTLNQCVSSTTPSIASYITADLFFPAESNGPTRDLLLGTTVANGIT